MPRKARDERLNTRTARLGLKPRREPYWRTIQEGQAIGYRRLAGGKAGSWIARRYDPQAEKSRLYQALGTADDAADADGVGTLTFAQAQDAARAWFVQLRQDGGRVVKPITVREAVAAYIRDYEGRGGKAKQQIEWTLNAHVVPQLGEKRVESLTTAQLRDWHHAVARAPARLRTGAKAKTPNVRKVEEGDTDGLRARRSTANNVRAVFFAALELAYRDGRVSDPNPWRRVKPFKKVDAARVRYLTDDEITRLINACGPGLRAIVTAAVLTGCRYQELARLRVADIDLAAGTATVREAKGGEPRHVVLTAEAREFFAQQAQGLSRIEVLFRRANGSPWGKSEQFRPLREACAGAKIIPAIGFHILRHTHASRLAMKGVPMAVIAKQLGHASERITAKHYAHLAPSYVADTIRAAFEPLGVVPASNVKPLRPAAA